MRTTTCILKFPDGQTVTASISADSPQSEPSVTYHGSVERLPRRMDFTDGPVLKALFKNLAKEISGTVEIIEHGDYDAWAI